MKRFLAVISATVSAAGMIFAVTPAASAAEARINTYTNVWKLSLTGVGSLKGFDTSAYYHGDVIRSPRLAFHVTGVKDVRMPATPPKVKITMQRYYVGGRSYIKTDELNSSTGWQISIPTASQVRDYEKATNVRIFAGKLFALPGVRAEGARHYRATDTLAQIGLLLHDSFGVPVNYLSVNGLESFAVGFAIDSAGRLAGLVITSHSASMRLSIADAFTYNRPMTIKAP